MRRLFFLSFALVALCALPAIVWAQSLTVGKESEAILEGVPTCDTLDQMRDVWSKGTFKEQAERLMHYNRQVKDGAPACGMATTDLTVTRVYGKKTVEGQTVYLISYVAVGGSKTFYAMTTIPIHDGSSV